MLAGLAVTFVGKAGIGSTVTTTFAEGLLQVPLTQAA